MGILPTGLDLATIAITVLTLIVTVVCLARVASRPHRYGENDPQPYRHTENRPALDESRAGR